MCLLIDILTQHRSGEKNLRSLEYLGEAFFLFIWIMLKLYLQFALSQRLQFYVAYGFYFSCCLYFPRRFLLEHYMRTTVLFIVMQDPC